MERLIEFRAGTLFVTINNDELSAPLNQVTVGVQKMELGRSEDSSPFKRNFKLETDNPLLLKTIKQEF